MGEPLVSALASAWAYNALRRAVSVRRLMETGQTRLPRWGQKLLGVCDQWQLWAQILGDAASFGARVDMERYWAIRTRAGRV